MDQGSANDGILRLTLGRSGEEDWDRLASDAARRRRALVELADHAAPRPSPEPAKS